MDAVRLIDRGVPSVTVTVVVAALTVPEAALIVVSQIPETDFTGLTNPLELIAAHEVVLELQFTLPVRSLVEPSLKVPVADICKVCDVVIVWSWGPMAMDESVGLTKKPVQPLAKAANESARMTLSFRPTQSM